MVVGFGFWVSGFGFWDGLCDYMVIRLYGYVVMLFFVIDYGRSDTSNKFGIQNFRPSSFVFCPFNPQPSTRNSQPLTLNP